MLFNYLFLATFANIPLVFGSQYLRRQPSQGHTCNCNCNVPKPMPYYDTSGQQTMVCIPVPIKIQGMYSQTSSYPGYMPPLSLKKRPIEQEQPKYMAVPEEPMNPPGYGGVLGGIDPIPAQQPLPGTADKLMERYWLEDSPKLPEKPDLFSVLYNGGPQAEGSEGIAAETSAEVPPKNREDDSPAYRDITHDYIID